MNEDVVQISVMDTTLRDGEQTPGVAYTPKEKLRLAKWLLCDVRVDRIEIASTRVSEGEREAATLIGTWAAAAGRLPNVEVLGFCDGGQSIDWIERAGLSVLNLLTKGSERHCVRQLRMTPEAHRARVAETVRSARDRGITVNAYLEDWSNGVRASFDYVQAMVDLMGELGVARIYLPDTLGVLAPDDVTSLLGRMLVRWPSAQFEFHGHNDYGLATANCLAAVKAGVRGVHSSVNGMGERAGNACLAEVVAAIHDHTPFRTMVDEERLVAISALVETYSGKDVAANAPVTGRDVFTQTAGVHADGDAKGDLYVSRLEPRRFGRTRSYALGKLSGKASLEQNLKLHGIELKDEESQLVLRRITELGDKKHTVVPEDLPLIIADVLNTPARRLVRIEHYDVRVSRGEPPFARLTLSIAGHAETAEATGAGGYDALMNALLVIAERFDIVVPRLADYRVRIPPGGRTEALVETHVTWRRGEGEEATFSTLGVDSDQLAAAVVATEKMLNIVIVSPPASLRPESLEAAQHSPRTPPAGWEFDSSVGDPR